MILSDTQRNELYDMINVEIRSKNDVERMYMNIVNWMENQKWSEIIVHVPVIPIGHERCNYKCSKCGIRCGWPLNHGDFEHSNGTLGITCNGHEWAR